MWQTFCDKLKHCQALTCVVFVLPLHGLLEAKWTFLETKASEMNLKVVVMEIRSCCLASDWTAVLAHFFSFSFLQPLRYQERSEKQMVRGPNIVHNLWHKRMYLSGIHSPKVFRIQVRFIFLKIPQTTLTIKWILKDEYLKYFLRNDKVNKDNFMKNSRVQFLFTSWERLENEPSERSKGVNFLIRINEWVNKNGIKYFPWFMRHDLG